MEEKHQLRQLFKKSLKLMTEAERIEENKQINRLFTQWWELHKAKYDQVFGYYPMSTEPDLLESFKRIYDDGYPIGLPFVEEETMSFLAYDFKSSLDQHGLGFFQPELGSSKKLFINRKTLVVVPCLALDQSYIRLGYGKGFYDRFQAEHPDHGFYLGVVWNRHVVDRLPRDTWDLPLHDFIRLR